MKQKALALVLSFAMIVSVCVPGTFATEAIAQTTLVCEKIEHTHTDACYKVSETPTCGLAEGDGAHSHGDGCYEEQSTLTCTLAEDESHTHGDGCYTTQSVLVCTQEESAGHTHDDSCYAKELTCTLEEHTHGEGCYQAATTENNEETKQPEPAQPVCNCTPVDGVHAETCPLYESPAQQEKKECTCGAVAGEDGTIVHAENCPLYQTSAQPEKKECTCGAVAGEDGIIVHAEDCPLYVAPVVPEKPAHIEGCADGCTVEGCTCPCHQLSLFERLMACETYDELCALLDNMTDEEFASLSEEQLAQVDALLESLVEPVSLPSYEYPPFVSVGPIIPYIGNISPRRPVRAPRAATAGPHVETGKTNEDGSIIYHDNVTVDKTIEQVGGNNTDTGADNIYKLTMSAKAKSMIVDATTGMDIILMLDMSAHMNRAGRVEALQTAVTNFINDVASRSPGSRIAIVRYAGTSSVLSGSQQAEDGALVTLDKTGKNALLGIVNSLNNPSGLSNSDQAMADAARIFQSANENHQTDSLGTAYRDRTRVSILFTAGVPGDGSWNSAAKNAAQAAMSLSVLLKGTRFNNITPPDNSNFDGSSQWGSLKTDYNVPNTGCGSTVYTVGLNLPEAPDPAEINTYKELRAYADRSDSNWSLKEESKTGLRVNEYLYRISSHRPTSEHFGYVNAEQAFKDKYDNLKTVTWFYRKSFDVKKLFFSGSMFFLYPDCITRNLNKGYFLTADDSNMSNRLNEIFTQISVQTGKPVEKLTIRDYIDPSFLLCDSNGTPLKEGATIPGNPGGTVKKDAQGRWYIEWNDVDLDPGDAQRQGKKEFNESIYVKPNDSLGGNKIPTNVPGISGVYPSENSVYPFPEPTVDLPIDYEIAGKNIDIYLTNEVKAAQLVDMISMPDGRNNAHVKIEYSVKKADGTVVGTATCNAGETQFTWSDAAVGQTPAYRPMNDESCTITCTITPVEKQGAEHNTTNSHHVHQQVITEEKAATAQINVFKPQLTFKDSEAWYGGDIPVDAELNANLTETKWLHGQDEADATKMGVAPDLALTFIPDASKLDNGKINTKQDVPMDVGVKIGQTDVSTHTTFLHTPCEGKTCELPQDMEFLLHINTCQLTVTKTGGAVGEPYVFTVMKDGKKYSEVTVVGNSSETIYELPVGSYTISEDEGWSWRYNANINGGTVLSSTDPSGSITCTNSKTENFWLNGFSQVVKNIFGAKN